MRILLVEDDPIQAQIISERLKEEFVEKLIGCSIEHVSTESAFRDHFELLAEKPPDLILMDVMLRWCDINEHMPPRPPEWDDFSRAGVRCCWLLKEDPRTRRIPVIVLTVLDNNNLGLPLGCTHVPKSSNFAELISEACLKLNVA